MSKRLLVVPTSGVSPESTGRMVQQRYGSEVEVHVVAPASGIGRLDWLANAEDDARADAHALAVRVAAAVPGSNVVAEPGDTDPVQAIRDALTTFAADEIVVVTCPDEKLTWLESGAAEIADDRFLLPVTHLVVD